MSIEKILANVPWRQKLLGLSSLFITGFVLIGAIAAYAIHRETRETQAAVAVSEARFDVVYNARLAIVEMEKAKLSLIAANEPGDIRSEAIGAIRASALLDENIQRLAAMVKSARVDTLLADFEKVKAVNLEVLGLAKRNNDADARQRFVEARPMVEKLNQALDREVASEREGLSVVFSDSVQRGRQNIWLIGALVAATIVAGLASSILAARLLTRPLTKMEEAMSALADGDFSVRLEAFGHDETARLMLAMTRVQSCFESVISAQVEMARQHQAGAISYRIDVAQLPGAYGDLARKVNDLVGQHVATSQKIAAVVGDYAKGNLTPDMDRLPGESATITASIDHVKAQLLGINKEIRSMVDAAAIGDFSRRGDDEQYEYTFREMVAGLNRLMHTCDSGLNEISRVLGSVAQGDLTARVTGTYEGAFERIKSDCNATVEQLVGIVREIQEAAGTIKNAAGEIAVGNADLSRRTKEQSSSLCETATSMDQLTATVRTSAENAREADALAVSARQIAVTGGGMVAQVVTTMQAITASSRKIADIIGVIDSIAFQTNILALNAAVEAARAGEQGRGFAVVATEVRNLAQRSAKAAREIKVLIGDSTSQVDAGSKLVADAGATMEAIIVSVKQVAGIMAEITAATVEQDAGIGQVNDAVARMGRVTQQNTELVQRAGVASQSMQGQAETLARNVGVFRLKEASATRTSAIAPPENAVVQTR